MDTSATSSMKSISSRYCFSVDLQPSIFETFDGARRRVFSAKKSCPSPALRAPVRLACLIFQLKFCVFQTLASNMLSTTYSTPHYFSSIVFSGGLKHPHFIKKIRLWGYANLVIKCPLLGLFRAGFFLTREQGKT